MQEDQTRSARALGWFSLGLGTAQLLAPKQVASLTGVPRGGRSAFMMRVVGIRELLAGVGILTNSRPAPWLWARVAGDIMDIGLLGSALAAPGHDARRVGVALAAVLGVTAADTRSAQDLSGENADMDGQLELTKAVTIRREPKDVYAFWRDFRNFPSFMSHIVAVDVLDDRRSHWRVHAPADRVVEWDAEIVEDRPNELISWRSLPGADVDNSGTVRFAPAPDKQGTEVRVELRYAPPGGELGATIARFFGQEPRQQVQADLRKLKQVLETGDVVRSEATLKGTHVFQRPAQPSEGRNLLIEARS